MIVRFFNTGTSCGEAPINYLLGTTNHRGETRTEPPEVLQGSPELTVSLINSISRKHKYSSGCIAFRAEEQPTHEQLHTIMDNFKAVVAPNLSPDTINSLFVLHREPPDKKTGLSSCHLHFIFPMVQLDGPNAGKRWNPHPPGSETQELMALFTSTTNQQMGWKQVQPNPLRVNIASFWKKVEGKTITKKSELLQTEIKVAVATGAIKDREQLCSFLEETLGMEITRKGADYLSVKFPGMGKAIRLKGPLFEADTSYERLLSANSQQSRSVKLTDLEYQTHQQRLSYLLQKRSPSLNTQNKDNNREPNHGPTRRTTSYPERTQPPFARQFAPVGYGAKASHPSHPAGTLWGDGKSGLAEKTSPTIPTIETGAGAPKNIISAREVQPARRGGAVWSNKIPTTSAEIDEQIRQLTIAMDDSSELGQRAIQDQICQLVGKRGKLPKPR